MNLIGNLDRFGLVIAFGLLFAAAMIGVLPKRVFSNDDVGSKPMDAPPEAGIPQPKSLFVLLHGMDPKHDQWEVLAKELVKYGHVVTLSYNGRFYSNADANEVAGKIAERVKEALKDRGFKRVVFIAHSMGAPLARRAILKAKDESWLPNDIRVVLLAGISRGWDLTEPPPDSIFLWRVVLRFAEWFVRLVGYGDLARSFERGAPFITNLRLDWMNWIRYRSDTRNIEVVQLLGDIDDIVSRQDNEDLRVMATGTTGTTGTTGKYALLLVRGTDHGGIVDFRHKDEVPDTKWGRRGRLAKYRLDKIVHTATKGFADVLKGNEELLQPPTTRSRRLFSCCTAFATSDAGRRSSSARYQMTNGLQSQSSHRDMDTSEWGLSCSRRRASVTCAG